MEKTAELVDIALDALLTQEPVSVEALLLPESDPHVVQSKQASMEKAREGVNSDRFSFRVIHWEIVLLAERGLSYSTKYFLTLNGIERERERESSWSLHLCKF